MASLLKDVGNWMNDVVAREKQESLKKQKQIATLEDKYRPTTSDDLLAEADRIIKGTGPLAAVLEKTRPPLVKPEEIPITLEDGCDEEYIKLADKAGMTGNPSVLKAKLQIFLRSNGYGIYEYERVAKYMDGLIDEVNSKRKNQYDLYRVWMWVPLREQDIDKELEQTVSWSGGMHTAMVTGSSLAVMPGVPVEVRRRAQKIYDKPIPRPVMETVADITEKLPESMFFVTDYVDVKPDPFLGVKLHGMTELLVIERWDEPKFR